MSILFKNFHHGLLGAALVGQRIAAGACELAVGEGLFAGLGERDEGDAAESEFAPPASDHEPLDPAAGSSRLHVAVQAVTVGVSSRRGGPNEGGRECLVGVAAVRLGLLWCAGGFRHSIHSSIYIRESGGFRGMWWPGFGIAEHIVNNHYSAIYGILCTENNVDGLHVTDNATASAATVRPTPSLGTSGYRWARLGSRISVSSTATRRRPTAPFSGPTPRRSGPPATRTSGTPRRSGARR